MLPPSVPRTLLPRALKALPAVTVTLPLAVMGAVDAKVVAAFTVRVWLPVAPSTTLALAVRGAVEAKVVAAFTVRVLLPPLLPSTMLPRALKAALAVIGAVVAKVVAALTVRVWLPLVPRTVLPAAVRVLPVLLRVTPAAHMQGPMKILQCIKYVCAFEMSLSCGPNLR